MEKIGVFVSGKIHSIVYDWNDAEWLKGMIGKDYPNKKISIRYID